jgi:nucleotide-binding universal stress UspA family protein
VFDKILVPIDGSGLAEQALPTALALARQPGARVLLLRVASPVNGRPPRPVDQWPAKSPPLSGGVRAVESYPLARRPSPQAGAAAKTSRVLTGSVADTILTEARLARADLIVMTTRGYPGAGGWVADNYAEKVLRASLCPVLITKGTLAPRRVLIVLDGTRLAERALEPGLEAAARLQAEVTLLHVASLLPPMPARPKRPRGAEFEPALPLYPSVAESAEGYVQRLARLHGRPGLSIRCVASAEPAIRSAPALVEQWQIDLVVMATHGRAGVEQLLYSGVTAAVLRRDRCSLLVLAAGSGTPAGEHN